MIFGDFHVGDLSTLDSLLSRDYHERLDYAQMGDWIRVISTAYFICQHPIELQGHHHISLANPPPKHCVYNIY